MSSNNANIGEREPLSNAKEPTTIDCLSQDSKDQIYRTTERLTTLGPIRGRRDYRHASQINIPKPRLGKDSPRAQIWAFKTDNNPRNFHRNAANDNNTAPRPGNRIESWISDIDQNLEVFSEMTQLSPEEAYMANMAYPLPMVTKENIKRLISQQVGENRWTEQEMKQVENREKNLKKKLEGFEQRYKDMEAKYKKERDAKNAAIAANKELTKELKKSRAELEEADGKAKSKPADSKKPKVATATGGAAAAKKPATTSKKPAVSAAAKKGADKKADDKKSAVKTVAAKKNGARKEVVEGRRTSKRIQEALAKKQKEKK